MTFGDWARYYVATDGRPPRPTLLRALEAFAREGAPPALAADLGCGIGRDTLPLLRAGWRVLALDQEVPAVEVLARRAELEGLRGGLEIVSGRFEDMRLPPVDLVNASFSLFACEPDAFPAVWSEIMAAIKPGGRFAGQLLGPRDSWRMRESCTILERGALDRLLDGLEIESVEEEETDAVTPQGEAKHWHIWHVNARRAS